MFEDCGSFVETEQSDRHKVSKGTFDTYLIKFIYGGIPLILTILITLCLAFMKVDEENKKLEAN